MRNILKNDMNFKLYSRSVSNYCQIQTFVINSSHSELSCKRLGGLGPVVFRQTLTIRLRFVVKDRSLDTLGSTDDREFTGLTRFTEFDCTLSDFTIFNEL